jgi:Fe-S oxidoreductase/nitrate reductase gamma subunit
VVEKKERQMSGGETVEITRKIMWGHPLVSKVLMYLIFAISAVILIYGIYKRVALWRKGKPADRFNLIFERLKRAILDAIAQLRVLKEIYPGIMHVLIYAGFGGLFIGTLIVLVEFDLHFLHGGFFKGDFYKVFSFFMELFGISMLLGALIAIFRRYVQRPKGLSMEWDDHFIILWVLAQGILGFLLEGARIKVTGTPDFEKTISFVGYWVSGIFSESSVKPIYFILWWLHAGLTFLFIAIFPWTKFSHILFSPLNVFFKNLEPPGALPKRIDVATEFEKVEYLGVKNIEDFTWKDLLDLDSCTRCGRCQDNCPAFNTNKPLSPKQFILDLRECMSRGIPVHKEDEKGGISMDTVLSCTTCGACIYHCPVYIEHVPKIVELRRFYIFNAQISGTPAKTLQRITNQGNPWGLPPNERALWAQDLEIKILKAGDEVEYLWWVGCAGSYDPRYQKVSKAFAKILKSAGVNFGILGNREKCTGESARRLGDEALFQMLAQENIETLNSVKFKKIITACPHCYNTIKNEYPQMGGHYEVVHHTEFIRELIKSGKIKLNGKMEKLITYHDPCYLGRYNRIFSEPREVISQIGNFKELKRHSEKSFCCGGGGGHMWMELDIGERINRERLKDIEALSPDVVAVACPFCLTMIDEALKFKNLEEKIALKDIAELVAEVI